MPRPRRKFSDEFKAETVELIRSSGKPIAEVARELDLTETAVRDSVVGRDEGPRTPATIGSPGSVAGP